MLNRTARPTRLAVAALSGALLLAGCASDSDSNDKAADATNRDEIYVLGVVGDQKAGEPKSGGTLEVVDYGEARSLDPTKTIPNGAVGGSAMAAIYDVLMKYDVANDSYVPLLAKALESKDDTTWTLTLRDGVKFSDGTALDADAVIASIEYYTANRGFNTLLLATNIADMKATDPKTVTFTLRKPWANFPSMLAQGPGMILAPAAIKNGPDGFKPIGAGPFTYENYKPAEELTLVRNEKYFGGAAPLDKLRFTWIQADQAKMDSLKGGSSDLINIRTTNVLEQARKDGYAGIMNPAGAGSIVWINSREGRPGSDVRIRQAINLAMDPQTYVNRALKGAGNATRNIFSPAFGYFKDVELPETDLEKAKALVAEAKKDGADTSLTYLGQSDQTSRTGAVTIEAQLESVGLDVTIETVSDVSEQTARIYGTHDFDLAMGAMSIGEDPYMSFANNVVSTSPANPSGFASKKMDALVDTLQANTPADSVDTLAEINQLWQEEVPGVVLTSGGFFAPWNEDVHGVEPTGVNILLFHKAWKS